MKAKIKIKKYTMNPKLPWEQRYKELDEHHKLETEFLINVIEKLESDLEFKNYQIEVMEHDMKLTTGTN